MIRIPEEALTKGLTLYPAPTDMYSRGDFDRPDLEPTTTIPMSIQTSWENPGTAELLRRGDITELTPIGPEATNVFPGVFPAPADTQENDYEDRIPRIQDRGDQVLRSRSGIRGPAQYWKYGGLRGLNGLGFNTGARASYSDDSAEVFGLGQDDSPVLFYEDPSEVAYQTYSGPSLGEVMGKDGIWTAFIQTAVGSAIALIGPRFVRNQTQKDALTYIGGFAGAIGLVNLIAAATK